MEYLTGFGRSSERAAACRPTRRRQRMKVFSIAAGVALVLVALTQCGSAQAQPTTVKGHVMDIASATKDVSKGAAVIADHDKNCLLMDNCVKRGYALVTSDMKMLKFDAKGNQLALD